MCSSIHLWHPRSWPSILCLPFLGAACLFWYRLLDALLLTARLRNIVFYLDSTFYIGLSKDMVRFPNQVPKLSITMSQISLLRLVGYSTSCERFFIHYTQPFLFTVTMLVQSTCPTFMFNINAQNTSRLIFNLFATKLLWDRFECFISAFIAVCLCLHKRVSIFTFLNFRFSLNVRSIHPVQAVGDCFI